MVSGSASTSWSGSRSSGTSCLRISLSVSSRNPVTSALVCGRLVDRRGFALRGALGGEPLRLGHHDLDDAILRDTVLLDLAVHDELAVALPRSDAEVRLASLSGAVHHAAHDGHADGRLEAASLEGLVDLLGQAEDVDLGPSARGAGH